jgi:RHS repeat-associated protein
LQTYREVGASGQGVSFKYDQFGRRVYKSSSSGTSIYAYDLDDMVEETNGSGAVVARYSRGLNIDEPLAMLRSSTTSYYQEDGLGSVTSLSNAAGTLAQTYTYDSFGNVVATTGSITNGFKYTGREFDTETNLQFSRARYYDPISGRFISEDPVGFRGDVNFYAYVENAVNNLTDPFGLAPNDPPPPPAPPAPKPPPIFYPPLWNNPVGFANGNNCYTYACNRLHAPNTPKPYLQPGAASGVGFSLNCSSIMAAARADGLTDSPNGTCPCNTHRIVLYIGMHTKPPGTKGDGVPDYHWYRQDVNGLWSSKHGLNPVAGQVSSYDKDARSWGYDQWCGSMCAPN